MFIDYISLQAFLISIAVSLLAFWALIDSEPSSKTQGNPRFSISFIVLGLAIFIIGFYAMISWPLPGYFNIIFHEPFAFFGLVLLVFGITLKLGMDRLPSYILAFMGGIFSIVMGYFMMQTGIEPSVPKGLMFVALGVASMLPLVANFIMNESNWKIARMVMFLAFGLTSIMWWFMSMTVYQAHTKNGGGFDRWIPEDMMRMQRSMEQKDMREQRQGMRKNMRNDMHKDMQENMSEEEYDN